MPGQDGSTTAPPGGVPAAGGSTPGTSTDGQTIPYARFKEVNDELKAYKELGFTTAELQEALVALAAFVEQAQTQSQAAERARAAEQTSGDKGRNQWTQQQWEQWALQTFPWLRQMKDAYDAQQVESESRTEWRVKQSQEKLKALATKAGYSEAQLAQLENVVAALIKGDEGMLAAWRNGDLNVIEQAFNAHKTGFVDPIARQYATSISGRKAANRTELPPKVTGGAAPPPQQPPKPKTVAEAHDAAMEKLAQVGSDLPEEEGVIQE